MAIYPQLALRRSEGSVKAAVARAQFAQRSLAEGSASAQVVVIK